MTEESYLQLNEFIIEEKSGSVANLDDNNNSTDKMLMSTGGYIASAVILFIIGITGFLLNFIALLIMVKEKNLRTPFNMILLNLTCSDLSVSILGSPITFIAAVHREWIFGRTVCVLYGFFMALVGITSITTITILSYERYLNIAKPFHSRRFTNDHSKVVIACIWIYSFMLTFPPLIGWGDYVNESANISCSVNWEHRGFSTTTYIIYLFVMGLALPVCIICYSYLNIILILMQKRFPNGRVSKVEVRVALMIAVMVAVFLLAWTPYAVLALIVAFGDGNIVTPAVSVIPALIAKSSICYNPIIYAGLNTQIRAAGYKILGFKKTPARSTEDYMESRIEVNTTHTEELLTETVLVRKSREIPRGDGTQGSRTTASEEETAA